VDTPNSKLTVLVAVDQRAAIRQGISAPSTAKVEIDLAPLCSAVRELLADCVYEGKLYAPKSDEQGARRTYYVTNDNLIRVDVPSDISALVELEAAEMKRLAELHVKETKEQKERAQVLSEIASAVRQHSPEEAAKAKKDHNALIHGGYDKWFPYIPEHARAAADELLASSVPAERISRAQDLFEAAQAEQRLEIAQRVAATKAAEEKHKAALKAQIEAALKNPDIVPVLTAQRHLAGYGSEAEIKGLIAKDILKRLKLKRFSGAEDREDSDLYTEPLTNAQFVALAAFQEKLPDDATIDLWMDHDHGKNEYSGEKDETEESNRRLSAQASWMVGQVQVVADHVIEAELPDRKIAD